MSDKSQNSHIERTVWVNYPVSPGDSVRYGSWETDEQAGTRCRECYGSGKVSDRSWRDARCEDCRGTGRCKAVPLTIIEYATGSDYSGTLVEISNARSLKKDFPWLVEIHGGHGTSGVAYLGKRENQSDALIEAIDSLTEYPLYSDADHSELEQERASEAWESDGRDDWKRALVKYFNEQYAPGEHDLDDDSHNEAVDALWYACTERLCGGESHLNEQGDSIYFPIDSVIKKIERCWPGMSKNGYDGSPSLDWMLVRLAEECEAQADARDSAEDEREVVSVMHEGKVIHCVEGDS